MAVTGRRALAPKPGGTWDVFITPPGPRLSHGSDMLCLLDGEDARLPGSPYDRHAELPHAHIPGHACGFRYGPRTCGP